jgi:hypothetical protein
MIDNQQRNKINRTKLGLGYEEAKFNYLNNSQFSCFLLHVPRM